MLRHYLDETDMGAVLDLVRRNGLRPVVDAVGAAALEELGKGYHPMDEFGQKMSAEDVRTASHNLTDGDLY